MRRRDGTWALALLVALAAIAFRAVHLRSAYDLFIDEVTYVRVGEGTAVTGGPELYGIPFHLHPPAVSYLLAGALRLLGMVPTRDVVDASLDLRWLAVLAAGATAGLLVLLTRRVAGPVLATAAGLVYAVDALSVRTTSRVLLEPFTALAVVGAVVVLCPRPGQPHGRGRLVAGGLLCGLAALCKEPAVVLLGAPLLLALLTGRPLPRRQAGLVALVAAVAYAPYPLLSVLTGQGDELVDQKLSGVLRLVGAKQETGFNAVGAPSLSATIVKQLTQFGATYALLGLGGLALLWMLWRRPDPVHRWIAGWAIGAYALEAYSVVAGTLEEQYFYYVLLPALVLLAGAAQAVWDSRSPRHASTRRAPRVLVVGVLAVVLGVETVVWAQVHATPDDGYVQVLRSLRAQAPCGAVVGVTPDTLQFVLPGFVVVRPDDLAQVASTRTQWLVTSSNLIEQGYGEGTPELLAQLASGRLAASVAFETDTRSLGRLVLWRVGDPPTGSCPVPAQP